VTAPTQTTLARRVELVGVLMIALTAVLTAWTAFESSKWGGVMSIEFSQAGATRTESVRASNVANRQTVVDVSLFTSYAEAVANDNALLVDFLSERFPERLGIAVDAWLATEPLQNPEAPATPFDMPEYVLDAADEADRLEAEAAAASERARDANQRSDNYTITTVFLATVILLAALSSKVDNPRLQVALLVIAGIIFVSIGLVVAQFPVEV
jgi:uncharacterized membrane protein